MRTCSPSTATTGALTFMAAPDFETPADAGGNNVYDVTVQGDGRLQLDTQAIAVTVTNANESAGHHQQWRRRTVIENRREHDRGDDGRGRPTRTPARR